MDNWKQYFRPHILERGYDYYESGNVKSISLSEEFILGDVCGSEDYEVSIQVKDGRMYDAYCSCPYATDGNYCKHMAAVLYCAEYEMENEARTDITENIFKKNNQQEKLMKVIDKIPVDELKRIVLGSALGNSSLRDKIMNRYSETIDERRKIELRKRVGDIINSHSDRSGFVDWYNTDECISELSSFLNDNVSALIERGESELAFELVCLVFMGMADTPMDDDGYLEIGLRECYEFWQKIIIDCSDDLIEIMYRWFDRMWSHEFIMDFAESFIHEFLLEEFYGDIYLKRRMEKLDNIIYEIEKNKNYHFYDWNLEYENLIVNRLNTMRQLNIPSEDINSYIKKYYHLPAVRQYLVNEDINNGNMEKAIAGLKECKKIDKDRHMLVADYSRQLIELYDESGMDEDYKKELRFQLLNCEQNSMEYVLRLKKITQESEWKSFVNELLNSDSCSDISLEIMDSENMYLRLIESIKASSNSVYLMDQYEAKLGKLYPAEICEIYIQYIKKEAKIVSDRKKYKYIVGYLKKIKQYPEGDKLAREITKEWRYEYSRRSAMMDELTRAGF